MQHMQTHPEKTQKKPSSWKRIMLSHPETQRHLKEKKNTRSWHQLILKTYKNLNEKRHIDSLIWLIKDRLMKSLKDPTNSWMKPRFCLKLGPLMKVEAAHVRIRQDLDILAVPRHCPCALAIQELALKARVVLGGYNT